MDVKKYRRRLGSVLMALCLLCLAVNVTAFAEQATGTLMVVNAEVNKDQVILTLTLPENTGVAAGKFSFNYDTDKLELVSANYDGFTGALVVLNSNTEGKIVASLASMQEIVSGGSVIAVFNLKENTYDNSYIDFTAYQLGSASGEVLDNLTAVETVPIAVECTHNWGEWIVTKEATCTEKGARAHTCTICGETETETIAALGHDDSGDWTVVKEATCTEAGTKELYCVRCGALLKTEVIPATPHNFGEWTVAVAATCTGSGEKVRECKDCGQRETEIIPALGHTEGEWIVVKEATENEEGLKELYCTVCGELLESETIPVIAAQPEETTSSEVETTGSEVETTGSETETTAEAEETSAVSASNDDDNNSLETGDRGGIAFVLFAAVAVMGCAVAGKKFRLE